MAITSITSILVPQRQPAWITARRVALNVLCGMIVGCTMVAAIYGWLHSFSAAARLVMWSLGLVCVGMFVGFLFGLPRILPGAAAPRGGATGGKVGGAEGGNDAGAAPRRADDAMMEIADWLAKIIAGLGLVNLREAPELLGRLARTIAGGGCGSAGIGVTFSPPRIWLRGPGEACAESFAMALAVFFLASGLMAGYLVTRLFLQTALVNSDRETGDATQPATPAEHERAFRRAEEAAQQLPGSLPQSGPEPDEATSVALAAMNAQYEGVSDTEYAVRVKLKNEITDRMYAFAVRQRTPREWLERRDGDGFLHVLATAVLAYPKADDVALVLRLGSRARMKHVKYRIVQALEKLREVGLVPESQLPEIRAMLKVFLVDADDTLKSLIELVRPA